jgi:DNA primase
MAAPHRARTSSVRSTGLAIAGVAISSPDRRLFPDAGLTKLDLLRYYEAVGAHMLPHLIGRPLTLKQCAPDVDHCRYLRHSGERAPTEVRVINIREQKKIGDYMIVDDLAGLIALAQRNIIEFHTWNSTGRQILIDYLRNNRTNTSIAAYSVRAKPTATVSVPITWEELTSRLKPERWMLRTVPKWLSSRDDPWADYFTVRQKLPL